MAEGSRLSGKVTVDAVPLEPQVVADPQSVSSRFQRPPSHVSGTRIHESECPGSPERTVLPSAQSTGTSRSEQQTLDHGQRTQDSSRSFDQTGSAVAPGGSLQSRSRDSDDEIALENDILKQVGKSIVSATSGMLPSSSMEGEVNKLTLNEVSDEEIEKYRFQFPDHLKIDYYDAMILYHDKDGKAVNEFLKRVNAELLLLKKEKPKVVLYDQILPPTGTKVGDLDTTLDYCTYVFMFITKTFCKDSWTEFSAQTALMNAIDNIESRWSVVPIFTEPKRKPTFKVPPSIRSLKGIQYWSDDKFYVDSLRKLLEDKLHLRLDKEEDLKKRRKQWIKAQREEERRKAERRQQEDQQEIEEERMKEKEHQRKLKSQHEEHQQKLKLQHEYFEQQMHIQQKEREQQQQQQTRIQIYTLQEGLYNFGRQGSASQSAGVDPYFQHLYHHMTTPASAVRREESAGEKLNQQGMAELPYMHHSLSLPSFPGKPSSNPSSLFPHHQVGMTPEHAQGLKVNPQMFHAEKPLPSAAESPHPALAHTTSAPNLPFSSQDLALPNFDNSQVSKQMSSGRTMYNTASDVKGEPACSRDAGPPSKHPEGTSSSASESATRVCQAAEQTGTSDSRSVGRQTMDASSQQAAQSSPRDASEFDKDGHDQKSQNVTEGEKNPELPQKDDLVEDVPHDSHSYQVPYPAPYPRHMGPQYYSEVMHQPLLVSQGPAHYNRSRARAEPDERDNSFDPRLRHPGNAAFGGGLPGHRPPPEVFQYMHPSPGQSPFLGQQQSVYAAGHSGPFFPGPFPPGYLGQYPYLAHPQYPPYPYFPDVRHVAPQAPRPADGMENLQYMPPWQHPPAAVPPPPRQQVPPSPQRQEMSQPAVFHHHHYHHGRGEEAAATTINYIKKAENVMVGSRISAGRARHPEGEPPPGDEEAQSLPEDMHGPESQLQSEYHSAPSAFTHEQSSQDLSRSEPGSSMSAGGNPPSLSSLSDFREQHNPSQLTQNVSRDDRSRQSSDYAPASSAAPVGLSELTSGRYQMYTSQNPASYDSPQYLPEQAPLQTGSDYAAGAGHDLQQWPRQYECDRETQLKRYIVGPSVEEESFSTEDTGNTSLKTRGSVE